MFNNPKWKHSHILTINRLPNLQKKTELHTACINKSVQYHTKIFSHVKRKNEEKEENEQEQIFPCMPIGTKWGRM